jgi:hypothetical protein
VSVQVGLAMLGIIKLKPSRTLLNVIPQMFDEDPFVIVIVVAIVE